MVYLRIPSQTQSWFFGAFRAEHQKWISLEAEDVELLMLLQIATFYKAQI